MTEQSIAEPRGDPRDTLDSDVRSCLRQFEMIHRRVECDGMRIRLSPRVHAMRRYFAGGIIRKINEIVDSADVEEPSDGDHS